ncbi:MAG: glycosyltransferase [Verrucomicrobiia bacterium]|jgi:glycosyltransferase involved in cell wall biosynthesis
MVSVIIPTYNRAQYIAETIEGVLAQTHQDTEIIVIDDGSKDNTGEVVKRFGDRVRYVWQQNSERAVSRNNGLKLSCGEFVTFPDSDDCWLPETLSEMLDTMKRVPAAGLVAVGCAIVNSDRRVMGTFHPGGNVDGVVTNAFHQLLHSNIVGSPSAVLLRRSVLDRSGAFDEDRRLIGVEDWELWARLSFFGPVVSRRKPLVHYRRHKGNFPIAEMRMRYPWVVEALLRNLPLNPDQRVDLCATSAHRLVEYAEELMQIEERKPAAHCLKAAAQLFAPIENDPAYRQLVAQCQPPDGQG